MLSLEDLTLTLKHVPIEYRPEVRWWLASGHHTIQTLHNEIEAAHQYGFGGMEFLAMDEPGIDLKRYGWGSEEWIKCSSYIAKETTRRNMAVSYTSGTNWSNANLPSIDPEHPAAAKELNFVYEDVDGGRRGEIPRIDLGSLKGGRDIFHRADVTVQHFAYAVACRHDQGVLSEQVDISHLVKDGRLDWEADGKWRLFYFWIHGTGQTANPSASTNYTVNYLDPEGSQAVIDYWGKHVFTDDVEAVLQANPRAQMYMDSLELLTFGAGGLFWGHSVEAEFKKRRGYSVVKYLPFLTRKIDLFANSTTYLYEPTSAVEEIRKVRFDLVKTYTDLYIESMLRPLRAFLHKHNLTLRSEISYGLPFELSRPGSEVDGIETESLEFAAQIDAYRLLGGAAHLLGKQYSSETGATLRTFMLPHLFYDQIICTQLAAGITKTVLHGWASTAGAQGTTWPGHEGMLPAFSDRFDRRQPGSEFYRLWSEAIGRKQYILRQGLPRIDIGIIRTDHFTDNLIGLALAGDDGYRINDEDLYGKKLMRDRHNLWWEDMSLQDNGWTYEFMDGSLLMDVEMDGVVQPSGPGYQALIVYQDSLDPDVALRLLDWARKGLPVVLVDNCREVVFLAEGRFHQHTQAAASTQGLDGRDNELHQTIHDLLSLPNTARIKAEDTLETLRRLGVRGRAEFVKENRNVLTHIRQDGDLTHIYLYHYLYETGADTEVELCVNGGVHEHDVYEGITVPLGHTETVKIRLRPGEDRLITLSPGKTVPPPVLSESLKLDSWDLVVDSWDDGGVDVIEEDRGLGYKTIEHQPRTKITPIAVNTGLIPWKDIPQVGPEVSGIGHYTTTIEMPSFTTAVIELGSTLGGLGSVVVNNNEPQGFSTAVPRVSGKHLKQGMNTIVVHVSSSLNNKLIARGYYNTPNPIQSQLPPRAPGDTGLIVRDYGLVGPVVVNYV